MAPSELRLLASSSDPAVLPVVVVAAHIGIPLITSLDDAGGKCPLVLVTPEGEIQGGHAAAKYVASLVAAAHAGPASLYPAALPARTHIDQWMDVVTTEIRHHLAPWLSKTASHDDRLMAHVSLERVLKALNTVLHNRTFLVGHHLSLADITVSLALASLFHQVLGVKVQHKFENVTRWMTTCLSQSAVLDTIGEVPFSTSHDGWLEGLEGPLGPALLSSPQKRTSPLGAKDGGHPKAEGHIEGKGLIKAKGCGEAKGHGETKGHPETETVKDGKGGAVATANGPAAAGVTGAVEVEDPEKKRKKEEKIREKELKKAKAAAKAEAAKAKAAEAASSTKKAEPKKGKSKPAGAASTELTQEELYPPTAPGEKKRLGPMAASYSPKAVEASWYEWWEKNQFFAADVNSSKPPFVIVIPPPNVTGSLHLGHGLTNAIQDTIVRWHRMKGFNTLWVPGVDHAGIATQVVVEKKIMKERQLTRHDLGRERFVEEVWKWKESYGTQIFTQLRRLGSSLDWSRECFTMDEKLSKAVVEAFLQMFEDKLIYRDNRLVNWDCVLKTAVSDIEVDYIEVEKRSLLSVPGYSDKKVEFGFLLEFAYPLEDGSGEIVVATTRPETLLGDTAVAVHPEDPRYKPLHGKYVLHPFHNTRLPIICDAELVDMAFGTGAVKITPAHDPNDFATGKRHNLQFINILTDDGLLNSNAGPRFEGKRRFDVREEIVEALNEKGLYRGIKDNPMKVPVCSRSKDVIEPLVKPQWYVRCGELAAAACEAVRDGRLEIIPRQFEDVWFRWLENIRDWCISRQLWWGHRIPAWYVTLEAESQKPWGESSERWVVGRDEAEATAAAKQQYPGQKLSVAQDPDVLDTWFSSGLFPFSVMGWPEKTKDMEAFYPTSLLETGHDILFFWVARMVMMGMRLTGKVPFKQVYLHAMVRDAHGRKMSKSLGNVIDPLEVIEGATLASLHDKLLQGNLDEREVKTAMDGQKEDFPNGIAECGADALRFALVAYTTQARDINLDIQRVVGYRLWCNKLWNAIKFAMMNLGEDFVPSPCLDLQQMPPACRWILSVLNSTVSATDAAMSAYDFSAATTAVYAFWQYQLCDVFIELIKPVMQFGGARKDDKAKGGSDGTEEGGVDVRQLVRDTLWECLDVGLRLLHPFMPFVTEELWQRLPKKAGGEERPPTIMLAPYPAPSPAWSSPKADAYMSSVDSVVRSVRSLRASYNLLPKQKAPLVLKCKTKEATEAVTRGSQDIGTLTGSSTVTVIGDSDAAPEGSAIALVDETVSAFLVLRGVVDAQVEIEKLEKKKAETLRQQEAMQKKISILGYEEKVPETVRDENAAKLAKAGAELASIAEAIENFKKLLA